ncbi:MAG: GAF domain-containing protein [Actinomycetota bacterium]|nr:GAF domain-containing protein [Actinomycetota bacterium]
MDHEPQAEDREALARAQETIARQAEEIERLRRRLADERFAEDLREALTLAASAGTIASPVTHSRLLEMIVETAAHVIFARAAALFLVDEEAQELVFEVALGSKAEEVRKFRVPLGHGIAGLVAVSGQPMAVSDAERDPRQAADIAQSVGYTPQSILCVPLFYQDQIIGVLELLDKEGAPSFSATDMEDLGLFANQAAVAIEQSRTNRNLAALLGELLQSIGGATGGERQELQERARAFAERLEEDAAFSRALDLARVVQEIAHRGENELKACQEILRGFAEYLRSRPEPIGELEVM